MKARVRLTLTLGTACILVAGRYIDGKRPLVKRETERDFGIARATVCIVRAFEEKRMRKMRNEPRDGGLLTVQARFSGWVEARS